MRPVRIATVYKRRPLHELPPTKMSTIRWFRISESLAKRGYQVDMIVGDATPPASHTPNLRFVSFSDVVWDRYNVIKTLFHSGFESVWEAGGGEHPFIISKLGSVVGNRDTEGVFFFEEERERLCATQERIRSTSRYVTVLTPPSRRLWEEQFGGRENLLLVPTGVDAQVPAPRRNPYRRFGERIAIYLGNIYGETQREMNRLWQARLNDLGRALRRKGIRLCFAGTGSVDRIDARAVTVLGAVPNDDAWDYQHFADLGIVLAQGALQHNESSKLYYYLRTGLPVISEAPVPNNVLLERTGMGFVADYGDHGMFADMAEQALRHPWPRTEAIHHMIEHHTWDHRVTAYDEILRREIAIEAA